jgi:hypothetical protein
MYLAVLFSVGLMSFAFTAADFAGAMPIGSENAIENQTNSHLTFTSKRWQEEAGMYEIYLKGWN